MKKSDIPNKGKQYGHNVSFSQRRTRKVWKPNLQTKTLLIEGKKVKMKVSANALRTLKKKGLLGPTAQQSVSEPVKSPEVTEPPEQSA